MIKDGQKSKNGRVFKSKKEILYSHFIPVTESGCWLWESAIGNQFGHGCLKYGGRNGKKLLAHRASYEIHNGEIPEGMCVLHRCDVPSCVNPDHLFLGTRQDNMDDMAAKNRGAKGSKVKWAKINEETALKIKESDDPTKELAVIYGISRQSVADIRYGRTWKHV